MDKEEARWAGSAGAGMTPDYVIVGAGSAGCALAYRLAEAGKRSRSAVPTAERTDTVGKVASAAGACVASGVEGVAGAVCAAADRAHSSAAAPATGRRGEKEKAWIGIEARIFLQRPK